MMGQTSGVTGFWLCCSHTSLNSCSRPATAPSLRSMRSGKALKGIPSRSRMPRQWRYCSINGARGRWPLCSAFRSRWVANCGRTTRQAALPTILGCRSRSSRGVLIRFVALLSSSRGQVAVVQTSAELAARLEGIRDRPGYIVEQYLQGVGVGVSVLANEGRIIQAFQHRRLREGRSGSSSRVSELLDHDLLKACQSICRHTNLTGICMFEFRYNPATQDWALLETNARFWGSLPLPLSLGVDFPRLLYELLVSKTEHPQVVYPTGIRARNFALDGRNLLAEIPGLRMHNVRVWLAGVADFLAQPLRWFAGSEKSDTFVADDLKPAWAECVGLVRSAAPRIAAALRSQRQPVEHRSRQHRRSSPHLGTQ